MLSSSIGFKSRSGVTRDVLDLTPTSNSSVFSSLLKIMKLHLSLPLLILFGLHFVSAQFNFFGNVFGGQPQHQQQRSGTNQWVVYSDSVSCPQYLCPQTLDCVAKPTDCPCPNAEDIKCIIPDSENLRGDGTVVCTRGKNDCSEVERLVKKSTQGKKK